MSRIEKELIKRIHSGKCVILVGSGASLDSGYPSWKSLVKYLLEENSSIIENTEDLLSFDDCPAKHLLDILDIIEKNVGKAVMVSQVQNLFSRTEPCYSEIHSIITQWPIPFYLTTNYDSEIKNYLQKNEEIFLERINTESDFRKLTATSNKEIYKIHGDFRNAETMILTKNDYNKVLKSPKFEYWREKILSLLMVTDILLIGYSASDPDFREQLEIAKKYANPKKPIFMFATGFSSKEICEYRELYNIQVIPYENNDGNHQVLRRLLKNYDCFIPKRNSSLVNREEHLLQEAELATSLFIFNDTYFNNNKIIAKALYNRILHLIRECHSVAVKELGNRLREKNVGSEESSIVNALNDLQDFRYIRIDDGIISLTAHGEELLSVAESDYRDLQDRFFEYCTLQLNRKGLAADGISKVVDLVNVGLVQIFRKRGIEIAKKILSDDDDVDIAATFDVAECLSQYEKTLSSEEYDYFIDLLFSVLEKPSKEVRDYLAVLCNGYFTYHILGHDEKSRLERLKSIQRNKIFLDSSILIPLLAEGCQNNKYAVDLVRMLKDLNTQLFITSNLLQEVIDHADWAIRNNSRKTVGDFDFYLAELEIGNAKENLFVSGGLNWLNSNSYTQISTYFEHIFGESYELEFHQSIITKLKSYGIEIINKDECTPEYYSQFETYKNQIKLDRQDHGLYRSELQCETEAELLMISSFEPISFITHTTNLKKFDINHRISHWYPEGLYRFIQMNDVSFDLDDLYNCMISGLDSCGIKSINREDLKRITKPYIHQAELRLKEISKEGYSQLEAYLEPKWIEHEIENDTLPLYTSQIEYFLNTSLKTEKKSTEYQIERLEKEKQNISLTAEERTHYERLKSKQQQKKLKKKKKHKKSR